LIVCSKAPGKMILLGEYAVLEGAPALVAAVDRYADVRIQENSGNYFEVESPSLGVSSTAFTVSQHGIICFKDLENSAVKKLGFFRTIFEFLWLYFKSGQKLLKPASITLNTNSFYSDQLNSKLGFGSSAAMTVALTQALYMYCNENSRDEDLITRVFRLGLSSHRKAQGNLGSGADVAASAFGGIIRYEMGMNKKAEQKKPQEMKIWEALPFACIWSGASESTRKMVRGVSQLKTRHPEIYKKQMVQMTDLAHAGCEAYQNQNAGRFLELVDRYQSCLHELGEKSGMPIVSPVHMELADKIRKLNGIYKPSGAGSGDIGVAFAETQADMQRINEMIQAENYASVPVTITPQGVHSYNE